MKLRLKTPLLALCAGASGYLFVALALTASQRPPDPGPSQEEASLDFTSAMTADYADLPEPTPFHARDGARLAYRLYGDPQGADRILILLHGSGWHGMQFHAMARALTAREGILAVVPDLRGHGPAPERRGDVDHLGQLEEDVADLIGRMRAVAPGASILLGGHSSGGGLAVRFAGGAYGGEADGFLLLAPFLKHDAPTARPNSGGWARPATRRIIGLTMLNRIGISALDGLEVISFAFPRSVLEGPLGPTATTRYTHRLNASFAPRADYESDLAAIGGRPLLLIAGAADEAFHAERYEAVIAAQTPSGAYHTPPEATHLGILTDPRVFRLISDWPALRPEGRAEEE